MDYFNEQLRKYEYKLLKEKESRREALEDMIRISEEAGLYEDEITVDEHLDAVDRARKLIHMREAQSSTNLDGETIDIFGPSSVDWQATAMRYMELNRQKVEIISRIRKLHELVTFDNAACGDDDCCGEYEQFEQCADCYCDYPCPTIQILEGER